MLDTAHLLILYDHGPWLVFPRLGMLPASSGTLLSFSVHTGGIKYTMSQVFHIIMIMGEQRSPNLSLVYHFYTFPPYLLTSCTIIYMTSLLVTVNRFVFLLVAASRGYSLLWYIAAHCNGFSLCRATALERGLSYGAWAWLLCSVWDLPRPGIEPMSPALAGRFLTPGPPGKS